MNQAPWITFHFILGLGNDLFTLTFLSGFSVTAQIISEVGTIVILSREVHWVLSLEPFNGLATILDEEAGVLYRLHIILNASSSFSLVQFSPVLAK